METRIVVFPGLAESQKVGAGPWGNVTMQLQSQISHGSPRSLRILSFSVFA
jgi:hypothetical protein